MTGVLFPFEKMEHRTRRIDRESSGGGRDWTGLSWIGLGVVLVFEASRKTNRRCCGGFNNGVYRRSCVAGGEQGRLK